MDSNLHIVDRLLELAKNKIEYSLFPKPYNKEYVFLSNVLNDSIRVHEREFNDLFKKAVWEYKANLKDKGKGFFNDPEKLVWAKMIINQLIYAVYGGSYVHEITFNENLGIDAYRDLICQIDITALMSEDEIKAHTEELNKIAKDIINEMVSKNEL